MNIQIYASKKNFDTQKAERFFKERRIPYQLLDLKKHKLGQRELMLFARRLGAQNLVDRQSPEALSHPIAHTDDDSYVLECLLEHPKFLRTPIVRNGEQVTLGADETTWNAWIQKG
ncbi:MAG: ArsC family transcriptional regulator [Clostridiales bacterium]|nr:ArsC family transcriptional regulator [Clostridiales bacterium]